MIKLNLQPTDIQGYTQTAIDIDRGMNNLYIDNPAQRNEFLLLAKKLLAALLTPPPLSDVGYDDLNAVADHLADSCQTVDDVYDLSVQFNVLSFLMKRRVQKRRGAERDSG